MSRSTSQCRRRLAILEGHLSRPRSLPGLLSAASACSVPKTKGTCVVVGVGPGIGGAVAKKFAQEGYNVAVTRRRKDKVKQDVLAIKDASSLSASTIVGYDYDARDPEAVAHLFDAVARDCSIDSGAPDVCIFNIGANVPCSILEETPRKFRKIWEMCCFAAFLVAKEAASRMIKAKRPGTIIFTGASASMRGKSRFAAFSSAKGALRNMAQSMARELHPHHIHVCHVVIDGVVHTPPTLKLFGLEGTPVEELVDPQRVAEAYFYLHQQHPSAWTHEMDIRPANESW